MTQILRTFHVPTTGEQTIDVSETLHPNLVRIQCGGEEIFLTKDAFREMCDLVYKIEWASEVNLEEVFPDQEPPNV